MPRATVRSCWKNSCHHARTLSLHQSCIVRQMPLELLTTAIAREHGRRRIGSAERTIALLGASAAAGPLAARAQQDGRVRRIGPLMAQAQHDPQSLARGG